MALVIYEEGRQVSGRLGATIHSKNRYGSYVRAGTKPVNPNTDRQIVVRNAVQSLTIRWHTVLTQDQRDAWDEYGANISWKNRLGSIVFMPGLNHYVRCNVPRLQWTIPGIDDAPTTFNLGDPETQLSATASEATQDYTIDGNPAGLWIGEADAWQFYSMGIPQNASIKFFGGPWRVITAVPGAGPPPFPVVIAAVWPIAEGQRLWLRSRVARGDGRLSNFARINFLCLA